MVQMSKEYMSDYYQKNKERYAKYNYTMHCEACNTVVPRNYWHRHIKTKKHLENVCKPVPKPADAEQISKRLDKLNKYKSKVKDYLSKIKLLEMDLGYSQVSSSS